VGKWKVSQNRSTSDRVGVVEALEREGTPSGAAIAALMRETLDGAE
jgi:transcriptional regulator